MSTMLALLLIAPPALVPTYTLTPPFARVVRAPSLQLSEGAGDSTEPQGNIRPFGKDEEKALRRVRIAFGGYPAGKYYELEQQEGATVAYDAVRADHATLIDWSDDEIKATVNSLMSTPTEILINSPIGPFLVLSALAIWRDGLDVWGIPPHPGFLALPF